jgi:hypothetical protein
LAASAIDFVQKEQQGRERFVNLMHHAGARIHRPLTASNTSSFWSWLSFSTAGPNWEREDGMAKRYSSNVIVPS